MLTTAIELRCIFSMNFLFMPPLLLTTTSIMKYKYNGVARCLGSLEHGISIVATTLKVLSFEKNKYVLILCLASESRTFYAQVVNIFIYKQEFCLPLDSTRSADCITLAPPT